MGNKILEFCATANHKLPKNVVVSILTLLGISAIYFIVCAMQFTTLTFEPERLINKDFWTKYSIILMLAIAVMVLVIAYKKVKLRNEPFITDKLDEILSLKLYLSENGLDAGFGEYLKAVNKNRKLIRYINWLMFCKTHAHKTATIEEYAKRIQNAEKDIDNIKIRIRQINYNVIFHGISSREEAENPFYNGLEGFAGHVFPTFMFSLILLALYMSIKFSPLESNLDTWINLASTLWVMTSYMLKGITFAIYSVNTVYYGALETRKGHVVAYLHSIGKNVTVKDNDTYKYKVVPVEENKEEQ